jgi:hypothetical protein
VLAAAQGLDDLPARLISEHLKSIHMHKDTYAPMCMQYLRGLTEPLNPPRGMFRPP